MHTKTLQNTHFKNTPKRFVFDIHAQPKSPRLSFQNWKFELASRYLLFFFFKQSSSGNHESVVSHSPTLPLFPSYVAFHF